MSKKEELSRCDVEFLRALATELNNSQRSYVGMAKNEIMKALANKLSPSQVQTIIKFCLLCREADEVAERIKQDRVNQINVAVKKYFDYDNMLYEVP